MAKRYGEYTQATEKLSPLGCAYECGSTAIVEQSPSKGKEQLIALGWHNPGGDRWHCPECCATDCALFFRKTGSYRDGDGDVGVHLECLGVGKSPRRFQSISHALLDEHDYRRLLAGDHVAIKIIKEEDLLTAIAS